MKIINIAGILILGYTLISDGTKLPNTQEVCTTLTEPEEKNENEAVVEQNKPTADNFSRPRKPCPPSGPGRR